jgi:tetratricopeptide (TPR) repeat protein
MAGRMKGFLIGMSIKGVKPGRILLVVAISLVGGWLSIALALSGVTRNKSPETALKLLPGESVALAGVADQLFFSTPGKMNTNSVKLATKAIEQQALNAKAIRLLGYAADAEGNDTKAIEFMKMAEKISRRDLGTQLWLIEYYAKQNNAKATLNQYDILLTTKPETRQLLFSRLSSAIDDQGIRAELRRYFRQNRPWMAGFLSYAIGDVESPLGLVNLIVEARGFPKGASSQEQEQSLLGRLVNEKKFGEARRLYDVIAGANLTRFINPAFDDTDRDSRFGAMGWQISSDPDASGAFVQGKKASDLTLSIFARASTTRIAASRLLYLTPGRYGFGAKVSQLERGSGGNVRFQLRCVNGDADTTIWTFDADPKNRPPVIDVPETCSVQFLDIVASGGKAQSGIEATIAGIAIARLKNDTVG